jgi:hypothetical protein
MKSGLIGRGLAVCGFWIAVAVFGFAQTNTFPASGNVGIGTTNPSAHLNVNESTSGDSASIYSGPAAATFSPNVQWILQQGKSNIGSFNDAGASSGNRWEALGVLNQDNSAYDSTGAFILGSAAPATSTTKSSVTGVFGQATLESAGTLNAAAGGDFAVWNNGTGAITSSANVHIEPAYNIGGGSIGTDYGVLIDDQTAGQNNFAIKTGLGKVAFGDQLDVAGQIHASGGVTYSDGTQQVTAWTGVLCGGDYAESMDVSGDRTHYGPGDLLVLDTEHSGKILKSIAPYSPVVSGIYATKPGVVGRRQLSASRDSEVPMAMVGVVPTKVSAENGPIQIGDLLVSSSTPGHAMKGTDRSRMLGAVVGKAMGSLDSGTGVIEVLVTLQ